MSNKKVKYVSLPLKRKYEIACKLSEENVNMSKLAIDLGVPRTTLINLRKSKDTIISEFEAGRNCEQKRGSMDLMMLMSLYVIANKKFRSARNERIPVNSKMLLLKARQFPSVCGHDNADKLDINWINRWKSREEVACKKLHGEAASVDELSLDNWQKTRLPILLKDFKNRSLMLTKLDFFTNACLTAHMF